MKTGKLAFFIFFIVNLAVALSCYFYPVTRDEFYYLDGYFNPFIEYYNSYFHVNPRLGQFFTNVVSRVPVLEVMFGLLVFNGFFAAIYLNLFQRFPNFRSSSDVCRYLISAAFFIFLINYFGEMFFYTPFSGNYTFTHIFYLFFVFLYTEYYVFKQDDFLKRIPPVLLVLFGIMTGMFNEHVPPVLLLMSFLAAGYFTFSNRKLPHTKLIVFPVSIFIGYLILFFAPANRIKEKSVGRFTFDIVFQDYLLNFSKILKHYFYYNQELMITVVLSAVLFIILRKKMHLDKRFFLSIAIYFSFASITLFIVAISPLLGTRLLFFSTSLIILSLLMFFKELQIPVRWQKLIFGGSFVFLLVYFCISVFATFNARENYENVTCEILEKKRTGDDVKLKNSFNYFTPFLGNQNRRFFLENGMEYIDRDPSTDTSVELKVKHHYQLKSLMTE